MGDARGSAEEDKRDSGSFVSLKALAASLVAVVQTRLQLLAGEVAEEVLRLRELWLLAGLAVFFLGLAVVLFTFFVIVVFWDSYRLPAIGGLAVFYLLLGIVFGSAFRKRAARPSHLFEASLVELKKDHGMLLP